MEPNPTARAVEWSLELEKGLRSKNPERRAEAILEFGPKLLQWSREPNRDQSQSAHQLFDLIPGEDRLFANATLLRLADAFRLGDYRTRVCVVKVFMAEHRDRARRRGWRYEGLLSKARVSNSMELLGRVNAVFDSGDPESKALALRLFGCWASFAAKSAHIRYLVLSSIVSSHLSEVKAALFAAGCFCEISEDFPSVVLEMMLNMMASSEVLLPIRLAAARVYAKVGKTYLTATRAYKTGLKLAEDCPEEDYQVALLVSLSKLASSSSILISHQVDLLCLFLNQEKTLRVREAALRCLIFIFSKGVCQSSVNPDLVTGLFSMLAEDKLPTSMQCEALRLLCKMIVYVQPSLPCDTDLDKLLILAENVSLSPVMSTSPLAISLLVDISKNIKKIKDMDSDVSCYSPIPSQVISLIFRRITFLVKSFCQTDSLKFQEINNLLNLLVSVVQDDLDLASLVIDQACAFVRYLSTMNEKDIMDIDALVSKNAEAEGEKSKTVRLKLAFNVYRFLVIFLECLSEADAITLPIFDKVKLLVQYVCGSKLLDFYTHTIYTMLLYSPVIWGYEKNKSDEICIIEGKSYPLLHNYSVEQELVVLEFANKVLSENKNWSAYKIGIYSACQGAWFTSNLIFQHLIPQVSSDSCRSWLKSLFHFANSGRKITLLLLTKKYSSLADMLEMTNLSPSFLYNDLDGIGHGNTEVVYEPNCSKAVLSAHKNICSSKETLEADLTSCEGFHLQRWFLSLRAKALQAMVDVFKTLETIPFLCENNGGNEQVETTFLVECLSSLRQVSSRLKRLVKEYELFGTSFIDMDSRSSKVISSLALSTSLLAFITGFSLFIPVILDCSTFDLQNSKNSLCAHLVQNLAGRLWYVDHETSTKLCQLIDLSDHANCFHLQFTNQAFNFGSEARDVLTVCRYALSEISCLRSKAGGICDEKNTSLVLKDVLQLTQKLVIQWMQIPFRTPKYFFRLRPCIGSELFAVSVTQNRDIICTLPGHHLPLSLCLQLKNVPVALSFHPAKLYCMIYSRLSFREPISVHENKEKSASSYQAWETDDMVEMSENLLRYVTKCASQTVENGKSSARGAIDRGFVSSFVCCEPNESGQGFASCLLDVSAFPPASYRIRWQCCCIDHSGNYWNLLPLNAGPVFTIQ